MLGKITVSAGLSLAVAGVFSVLAPVHVEALPANATGDAALINVAREAYDEFNYVPGVEKTAIAYIDGTTDTIKIASFNTTGTDRYEIASISKTFFANMYADAKARGVVTSQTKLKDHTPVRVFTGNKTLESLAKHTSGLPGFGFAVQTQIDLAGGGSTSNPLDGEAHQFMYTAGNVVLMYEPGLYNYSNLGYSLLGDAVAHAEGKDWAGTLVQDKVFTPLGMTSTTVPWDSTQLTSDDLSGFTAAGAPSVRWAVGAYAPAGGIHSTIGDMGKYALALLNNEVPGANTAMTPTFEIPNQPGTHTGYSWQTQTAGDRLYMHHGGTNPGFSSMIMFDPAKNTGVVMLSNKNVGTNRDGRFEAARMILDRNGQ